MHYMSLKNCQCNQIEIYLDIVEKHAWNVYDKKIVNDKDKNIIRWKSFEEYQQVKNEDEYKKCKIRKGKTWGKLRNHLISNKNMMQRCYPRYVVTHYITHYLEPVM